MDGTTATSKPTVSRRFELPALSFKFESLTEGTDIPPPQPSPVREVPTPPQTPPIGSDKNENQDGEGDSVMTGTTAADGVIEKKTPSGGVKRSAEDMPLSPALSARQGSIRRLFSRSMLNNGHADVHNNGVSGSRPPSQAGSLIQDDKKSKRSSGWFRRLRGGGDTHLSPKSFDEAEDDRRATFAVPAGPPPPVIPELTVLESKTEANRGDQWASDMFKNIS